LFSSFGDDNIFNSLILNATGVVRIGNFTTFKKNDKNPFTKLFIVTATNFT